MTLYALPPVHFYNEAGGGGVIYIFINNQEHTKHFECLFNHLFVGLLVSFSLSLSF